VQIYSGTLRLKKKTKGMVVYGNDQLAAQYLPKPLLEKAGLKSPPPAILFVLSIPSEVGSRDVIGATENTPYRAASATKATR
jgi:hypothetical protein